jgi:hypothetical protein
MKDWIPAAELKLLALCHKWLPALRSEEARTQFRWDADLCSAATSKIEPFVNAFAAYENSDTTSNRKAKNETMLETRKALRAFATSSMRYNPFMTMADRQEFGLNVPDTVPTVQKRPDGRPNTVVEKTKNFCEHKIVAINPDNGKASKPAGAYGVRFVWRAGGERPASASEIAAGRFSRNCSVTVAYDETELGKTAYYASCYENAKGEAGPWSAIVTAIIS